ncbi:hypothetical protein D3C81_941100 [compost metagenome]
MVVSAFRRHLRIPGSSPCEHRLIITATRGCEADVRQLLLGEIIERGAQHRRQRDVLQRVINDLQERQHRFDLGSLKIPLAQFPVCRDPFYPKLLNHGRCPGQRRTQQNHHVPESHRTHRLQLFIKNAQRFAAFPQHPADTGRNRTGLQTHRFDQSGLIFLFPAFALRRFAVSAVG